MLGVTLSRDARARAVQLPAWNEALGLPRPWDQQWSLRMQQILAFETDLLEYDDLFTGSVVVEQRVAAMIDAAQAELDEVLALGGAFNAIDELKARLVRSHTERTRRIESGDLTVVGVNRFTETTDSPLGGAESILKVDPAVEAELVNDVRAWRAGRNEAAAAAALDAVRSAAQSTTNIMPSTIAAAHAGVTTGEWAGVLREVFGEFRAPTGVGASSGSARRSSGMVELAARNRALVGGPPRLLVGKPGLDGHSNGAEQIAVAARDAGMEVIYEGIRSTPEQIANAARDEDPDVIGLSILSGSHLTMVGEVMDRLRAYDIDAPVVVGGIIPEDDRAVLLAAGVKAVYTPKDFDLTRIMDELSTLAAVGRGV
jgi:ethylmalonyl-CoA mutase